MKLTGKCKAEFEKWFFNQRFDKYKGFTIWKLEPNHYPQSPDFKELPDSMKFGVFVDYANDIGIQIGLMPIHLNTGKIDRWDFDVNDCRYKHYSDTLPEARDKAIEALDEIRNEQLDLTKDILDAGSFEEMIKDLKKE